MGRTEIEAAGMGAFAGVAQGSDEEPQLITLRYEGPDATGPLLGLVGKAVTFDSGGISIKPGDKMTRDEVRHVGRRRRAGRDGGDRAARAAGPRARGHRRDREHARRGHAMKPGDIVRARNGTTIEVINTDAEGRLVLADCLAHAVDAGRRAARRPRDADGRDRDRARHDATPA